MKEIEEIKKILNDLRITNSYSMEERYRFIKLFLPKGSDVFSSQEGEDILIKRLLKRLYNQKGFYIDIGAYDPIRFSNTFHFYLKGWHGINIDPNKQAIELFKKLRPRDLNLNLGIGNNQESLEYFEFEEGAFNTFSEEQYKKIKNSNKTKFLGSLNIPLDSLENILKKYLPEKQDITFMSVDVEGFELEVLNSNNWDNYRPIIICIEALDKVTDEAINTFMLEKNYLRIAKTKNTIFYVESSIYKKLEQDEKIDFNMSENNYSQDTRSVEQLIKQNLNPQKPICSIHIPKCGGTSFREVLVKYFAKKVKWHYYDEVKLSMPEKYDLKAIRCIHGHFNKKRSFGIEDYYNIEDFQYITMLRDPLDIMISTYFYNKNNKKVYRDGRKVSEIFAHISLNDYISKNNCYMFLHFPWQFTKENYKEIIDKNFIFIGIMEEYQKSIDILSFVLNKASHYIPHKNISTYDEDILSEVKEDFIKRHELEYLIYSYAKEKFLNIEVKSSKRMDDYYNFLIKSEQEIESKNSQLEELKNIKNSKTYKLARVLGLPIRFCRKVLNG